MKHEDRLAALCLAAALPAVVAALVLLWTGAHSSRLQWSLTALILAAWWGFAFSLRGQAVRHLKTLSNLLASLAEEDYSVRASRWRAEGALGEVFRQANSLAGVLRDQRLGAMEAAALLRTVMAEIDVAVFAFDQGQRLRLVNRAGERVLDAPAARLLGKTAAELGLADCLGDGEPRTVQMAFPGATGRWGVRVSSFWERGLPQRLLVLTDLTRALREEELEAWKRLVRVLGHELNNSLAPIKSIAGSLQSVLERGAADWKEDMAHGLAIIAGRADALTRFMGAYAALAKLPPPRKEPVRLSAWIPRVVSLERRVKVDLAPGPDLTVRGDGDQLDQLLINLLRNAADAALETGGGVEVGWKQAGNFTEVWVRDEGPGIPNDANLFVPFFTTKPGGSGIGLVLSRQIAEAHGGALTLENRSPGPGCEARLRLPLARS